MICLEPFFAMAGFHGNPPLSQDMGINISSASTMPDNYVVFVPSPRASSILCLHVKDVEWVMPHRSALSSIVSPSVMQLMYSLHTERLFRVPLKMVFFLIVNDFLQSLQ